jgi:flagellar biosynthesis protein
MRRKPGEARLAVALRAEASAARILRVLAQAKGGLAEQLCRLAEARGVTLSEDRDLAALLSGVELDEEIPAEAFATLGALLTCLYHANRRAAAK